VDGDYRQPLRPEPPSNYLRAHRAAANRVVRPESRHSNELTLTQPARVTVFHDQPADFSWTYDVWSAEGKEIERNDGLATRNAVKEIIHRADGVIAREWYNWGFIQQRHDLNHESKAIRRLRSSGKLFRRELQCPRQS
jgi:hypothetical protein